MTTPDPTSPAGMTKPEMKRDLLDKHGWSHEQVRSLFTRAACEKALIQARLDAGDGLSPARKAEREQAKMDAYEQRREAEQAQAEVDADDDTEDISLLLSQAAAAYEASLPPALFLGMPGTNDFIFDGHAGAGPSGAERWMNCTASLGAVRRFLETLSVNQQYQFAGANTAARQGTTAHAAAEAEVNLLLGNITPEEHESTLLDLTLSPADVEEAYDEEMAQYITEYTDFVQSYIDEGHQVMVEARLQAIIPLSVEGAFTLVGPEDEGSWELPDHYAIRGSGDFLGLPTPTEPVLTVGDLKYGDGIDVDVESNPQIRIYALGALSLLADDEGNLPRLDRIDYAIIQPRLGGIKTWTESVDALLTWRDEVLSPALTAALGFAPAQFVPSDLACQWCPVQGSCAALAAQRVEQANDLFDVIVEHEYEHGAGTLPDTGLLSDDRLGELLAQVTGLVALRDSLKEEAQRRMHRGHSVPGFVLVNYQPPRKWVAGAETDETLADLPVWKPQTLLTPKQALTVLGEKAPLVSDKIQSFDPRPVVAREGDKRSLWTGKPPEQMFPEITD